MCLVFNGSRLSVYLSLCMLDFVIPPPLIIVISLADFRREAGRTAMRNLLIAVMEVEVEEGPASHLAHAHAILQTLDDLDCIPAQVSITCEKVCIRSKLSTLYQGGKHAFNAFLVFCIC